MEEGGENDFLSDLARLRELDPFFWLGLLLLLLLHIVREPGEEKICQRLQIANLSEFKKTYQNLHKLGCCGLKFKHF